VALKDDVLRRLRQQWGELIPVCGERSVYRVKQFLINVRTATSKRADDQYWFDVTPRYYEEQLVNFLVYACWSPDNIYIFPVDVFETLIQGASLGGQKQVPNFTIDLARDEFEPAGDADARREIQKYLNYFAQLS
jgi:hypothetical protein